MTYPRWKGAAALVLSVALPAVCGTAQAQSPAQFNARPLADRQSQKNPDPQAGQGQGQKTLSAGQAVRLQQFSTTVLPNKLPIQGNPSYEKDVGGHKVKTRLLMSPMQNMVRQGRSSGETERKEGAQTREGGLVCRNATVKVTLADDSFKSSAQSAQATRLQPGVVYDFDSFFSGRMVPASGARHPVRLALPNVTGMTMQGGESGPLTYIDVEKPDLDTLNEGAQKLKNRLPRSGNKHSASFDIQEIYSGSEALLKLTASAAAYGAKVGVAYDSNNSKEDRQILIDATQEMFTVTAQPASEGIFVNPEDAKKGNKIMLGNVTYGHRVLLAIKTQTRDESKLASATASYANFVAQASASVAAGNRTFSGSTNIRMYDVGNVSMAPPSRIDQVDAWLKNYFAKASLQNAQPIRYQFVNMNNEIVRSESATDTVPVRNCVQDDMTLKVKLEEIRNLNVRENQNTSGAGASVGNDTRNEVVKFGTRQTVHAVVGGKDIHDARGRAHHSICWWGDGDNNCTSAREFNGRVAIPDGERAFPIKASLVGDRDYINIHTAYVAMYRTKVGGSTNGKQNPQPADKVYINDVIAAGSQGKDWYVQVPWNGRLFEYKYRLWAE